MVPPRQRGAIMGLMECPDCDGRISDSATKCPHCGKTLKEEPVTLGIGQKIAEFIFGLIFLLALAYFVCWYFDIDISAVTKHFQKYARCDTAEVTDRVIDIIKEKRLKGTLSQDAFNNLIVKLDLVRLTKIDKDIGFCECKADLLISFNNLDDEISTPITFSATKSYENIYYEVSWSRPVDFLKLEDL
jgi:uncharacterized membrane protein